MQLCLLIILSNFDCGLSQGKVPFVSAYGIHQLHIFIFVLAVVHVIYCIVTYALGKTKVATLLVRSSVTWKSRNIVFYPCLLSIADEEVGAVGGRDKDNRISILQRYVLLNERDLKTEIVRRKFYDECILVNYADPGRFRFARDTTFGRRHLNAWSKTSVTLWTVCFFRQFFGSVTKVDYLTLRHGFITVGNSYNLSFVLFYLLLSITVIIRRITWRMEDRKELKECCLYIDLNVYTFL